MKFNIDKSALKKISDIIKNNTKNTFKISVLGGGCSGFKYEYTLLDKTNDSDHIILKTNDFNITIDHLSKKFLEGCTIKYIEELGASYFDITNPNTSSKCSCGNSFTV